MANTLIAVYFCKKPTKLKSSLRQLIAYKKEQKKSLLEPSMLLVWKILVSLFF